MRHLGKCALRGGPHFLRWAILAHQMREAPLDLLIAAKQRVIVGVADFGRVLVVIKRGMMRDLGCQRPQFCCGFVFGELVGGDGADHVNNIGASSRAKSEAIQIRLILDCRVATLLAMTAENKLTLVYGPSLHIVA